MYKKTNVTQKTKGNMKEISSYDAIVEAQKIAFAPVVFQTTVALKNLGILEFIFKHRKGVTLNEISEHTGISTYGVNVLLEMAESSDIVSCNDGKYTITKVGYFLKSDAMTTINMNFINDVCYKGLFHLEEAIKTGNPAGLKELGNWPTIYEGLSQLTPKEQKSWFEFDHFYSDNAFDRALEVVFNYNPKWILDIGGNTGKWSMKCCEYNQEVKMTILDLPGQLNVALKNAKDNQLENRILGTEIDLLSENPSIPKGADAIWMSQFLDCFSREEIVKILKAAAASMDKNTKLHIMETFTDRQKIENATFCLRATSIYFTAMANGNSQMYRASEFYELISKAGLRVVGDEDKIGEYHTILTCELSPK
jgi:ubiquinone/menaquinone biosynthesis C-methylase UbiE